MVSKNALGSLSGVSKASKSILGSCYLNDRRYCSERLNESYDCDVFNYMENMVMISRVKHSLLFVDELFASHFQACTQLKIEEMRRVASEEK